MIRLSRGPTPGFFSATSLPSELGDPINGIIWQAKTTITTASPGTTENIFSATTPAASTDWFTMHRGLVGHGTIIDTSLLGALSPSSNIMTRCIGNNVTSGSEVAVLGGFHLEVQAGQSSVVLGQEVTEQTGDTDDAFADKNATFALPLSNQGWVDDTDYFFVQGSNVTMAAVSADTPTTVQTHTFDIQETGEHLVFWKVRIIASGQSGSFGYQVLVDDFDPYNVVSGSSATVDGFKEELEGGFQRAQGGVFTHDFTTTGNHDFDLSVEVSSGIAGSDTNVRLELFVIPSSKFANVYHETIDTQKTNAGNNYSQGITDHALGPITSTNPVLIISSAPCDASGVARCFTRFTTDGNSDLSEGDDFGTSSTQDTTAELHPITNFVYVEGGLNGETIGLDVKDANAQDSAIYNSRDDGSADSNSYLIVIELATPAS